MQHWINPTLLFFKFNQKPLENLKDFKQNTFHFIDLVATEEHRQQEIKWNAVSHYYQFFTCH
jgi:hypothetical protein